MGRKKIIIEPIREDRNRQVTFMKRKQGLLKKAMELSILCKCEVSVLIFSEQGKMFEYASNDMDKMVKRREQHSKDSESKTNHDFQDLLAKTNGRVINERKAKGEMPATATVESQPSAAPSSSQALANAAAALGSDGESASPAREAKKRKAFPEVHIPSRPGLKNSPGSSDEVSALKASGGFGAAAGGASGGGPPSIGGPPSDGGLDSPWRLLNDKGALTSMPSFGAGTPMQLSSLMPQAQQSPGGILPDMGDMDNTSGLQSISGWSNSPGMPNSDPRSLGSLGSGKGSLSNLMSPPLGSAGAPGRLSDLLPPSSASAKRSPPGLPAGAGRSPPHPPPLPRSSGSSPSLPPPAQKRKSPASKAQEEARPAKRAAKAAKKGGSPSGGRRTSRGSG